MSGENAPGHVSRLSAKPGAAPIVFVVDDDISVRESLEALIRARDQYFRCRAILFVSSRRLAQPQ